MRLSRVRGLTLGRCELVGGQRRSRQRTCQFSPANLVNSRSSIFSRVLALNWRLVNRRVETKSESHIPFEFSHASLVLPLRSLKQKFQVLVLPIELLDRFQWWSLG